MGPNESSGESYGMKILSSIGWLSPKEAYVGSEKVIICDAGDPNEQEDPDQMSPRCVFDYELDSMVVTVQFAKKFLPARLEIEAKATHLIESALR
jgi:hypothetical protein